MLIGETVLLRPRVRDDLAVLYRLAAADPALHQRTAYGPWVPRSLAHQLARYDAELTEPPDPLNVKFTVEARVAAGRVAHGDVVGEASLWDVDPHQRSARVGLSLVAEARGLGFGADVVRVLCDYGFRIRGLHRLSCETLASNPAMIRAASSAGFALGRDGRCVPALGRSSLATITLPGAREHGDGRANTGTGRAAGVSPRPPRPWRPAPSHRPP
jgi:RimJ/RimL family protein N-acetyltransferase